MSECVKLGIYFEVELSGSSPRKLRNSYAPGIGFRPRIHGNTSYFLPRRISVAILIPIRLSTTNSPDQRLRGRNQQKFHFIHFHRVEIRQLNGTQKAVKVKNVKRNISDSNILSNVEFEYFRYFLQDFPGSRGSLRANLA